jgi:hypothetical protein
MDHEMRMTLSGVLAVALWGVAILLVGIDTAVGAFAAGRIGLLCAIAALGATLRCSMAMQAGRTRAMIRALVSEALESTAKPGPTRLR